MNIKPTVVRQAMLRRATCLAAALLLCACSSAVNHSVAQEPGADTACTLDGMILNDFPGPKAQIQYAEGKPEFYCDLIELFSVLLVPEQKRRIGGVFVQDMGQTDWNHPSGHWIDAKGALYVVGSKKRGSMGPTFASFSSDKDAAAFIAKEGGKVYRYEQIKPDMVSMHSGAAHDSAMSH